MVGMADVDLADVDAVIERFVAEVTDLLYPLAIWEHGSLAQIADPDVNHYNFAHARELRRQLG